MEKAYVNCNFDGKESVQVMFTEAGGTTIIEIEVGVTFSDNTGC
jgi:putative heme iron utilization protein